MDYYDIQVPRQYSEFADGWTDEWSDIESQVFLESLIYYSAMENKQIQRAIDNSFEQKVEDNPLPDRAKNKLRKCKYSQTSEDKCAICQDLYCSDDDCIYLPCGHFYHDRCISEWFDRQSTCPHCRVTIK
jgi:hypothetical protein